MQAFISDLQIDKFLKFRKNAYAVGIMSGKLRNSVRRETVPLNKGRAFIRNCNIPRDKSHLRNHLRSIQAHFLRFFPVWNLEADNARIRHRMFDKRVPLFVGADSLKLSCCMFFVA